ncbi:extracellular solute-binding protein [Colwellia sp. 1_MG-2023]|uniref:extracellular solute-binding protein n=1 Tax=unclassified Colwellia TaxID=196834 RepID=UPI001C090B0C|nr:MULTISPECIES: extracellular solute-binding protein [unclassified Colwellia]MBU2924013.1 extracellular solute-binding protein [Colwellia sp. C2M11]MDO6653618.1 extracellular solute-binding protein [Colwellia sp. 3_MG-2023]MDO6666551.1 extracellular solute-binding protein [Colwellia sp. 2_MG-2023]MDO6690994.1 extracellular solute-binding protein [Colwellia sp. 1_MG-2023]
MPQITKIRKKILLTFTSLCLISSSLVQANEEVNVYSYRQAFLVKPLFDKFTENTGIKVNVIFAKTGMAERLEREGKHSPADVLLTTDISRLIELQDRNLLQANDAEVLLDVIPSQYRAKDNTWFALTTRVRNIYSAKRLGTLDINYEDLADSKYKGRICTRSGKHAYNIALVSSMIAEHGSAETLVWLEKFKANLARKPQGNDRGQVQAIHQNLCDISLGNSYYFGRMLSDEKQKVWAEAVNINFPNQSNRGAHVNISGMGMAKFSPNTGNAKQLMAFLISKEAQQLYAETNVEYPVRADVMPSELVASWGKFKADDLPLETIAKYRKEALKLIDQAKFDL